MLGRATLTMDASRTTMNCATHSKISAVHRFSRYSWAVVIPMTPFATRGVGAFSLSLRMGSAHIDRGGMLYLEGEFRVSLGLSGIVIPFACSSSHSLNFDSARS